MEELEEIVKWIDNYEIENNISPHSNLIRIRMELRIKDIKAKNNEVLDLVSKSLCSADWCTNEVQSEGNKLCNMCRGHKE